MDTFETALTLVKKDMFMCTSDIRLAYYSVPVAEESKIFFRFLWKGKIFQYACIPNGYKVGPDWFTKVRAEGHICTGFIDDNLRWCHLQWLLAYSPCISQFIDKTGVYFRWRQIKLSSFHLSWFYYRFWVYDVPFTEGKTKS